jgi:hypothetical protein
MNLVVRAFVVALALTGAVATASSNRTPATKPVLTRTSAMPIPSCPPNDPNACHINDGK